MQDDDSDQSFIPADHLAEIGRITNAWAHFEFAIDRTTWDVCDLPHQLGACLTAQIHSARDKMNALIHACALRQFPEGLNEELREFRDKVAGPLQTKRNRVVHDTRMIKQSTQTIERLQITARSKLTFGFTPEPTAELCDLRREIEAMIYRFSSIHDRIVAVAEDLPSVDLMHIHFQRTSRGEKPRQG
jgi:hypothetical protein